jgi:hypothetical protein
MEALEGRLLLSADFAVLAAADSPASAETPSFETHASLFDTPSESFLESLSESSGLSGAFQGMEASELGADSNALSQNYSAVGGDLVFDEPVHVSGSIEITADTVTIRSSLKSDGGSIVIRARSLILLESAASLVSEGGMVLLQALEGDLVALAGSSVTSVNGDFGGDISLLGNRVALIGAAVDASGKSGGGTVLIGGDLRGGGAVQLASQTSISSGTVITSSATEAGTAGSVVVWSQTATRFHGDILSRAGSLNLLVLLMLAPLLAARAPF